MERIVLAYSGGLNTTAAIAWLRETRHADVIALTVDLGQGAELESLREQALAAGCSRAHVLDGRAEFASRMILPALRAGAMRDGRAPLSAALSRPLVAAKLVEIARIEDAHVVAHGGGGGFGRLERALVDLDQGLTVLAPARAWDMKRADTVAYLRAQGVSVPVAPHASLRVDTTLWARSAVLAPETAVPAGFFSRTEDPARARTGDALVDVAFERGVPVAVNGVPMPLVDVIGCLDVIAAHQGVGRIDAIRQAAGDGRTRELAEAPAAVVLTHAHAWLEAACLPPGDAEAIRARAARYADLIDRGGWFAPARSEMDAAVEADQERVTGVVRVRLARGTCEIEAPPANDGAA